jgi:hypothetical protein
MFLLYRVNLGAPIWPIEVGAPGFSRSEPIVITPLEECDFDRQFLFDEYVAISHQ